jgi:hypothetical protein
MHPTEFLAIADSDDAVSRWHEICQKFGKPAGE